MFNREMFHVEHSFTLVQVGVYFSAWLACFVLHYKDKHSKFNNLTKYVKVSRIYFQIILYNRLDMSNSFVSLHSNQLNQSL